MLCLCRRSGARTISYSFLLYLKLSVALARRISVHTVATIAVCVGWMLFGRPRITDRNAAAWGRAMMVYGFIRLNRLLY